jgi:hypothetical protein
MAAIAVSILSGVSNTLLPDKVSPNIKIQDVTITIKFIFCLYKSLSNKDILLLQDYGKVIFYDSFLRNIDCKELTFDYFILNMKNKEERTYYQKFILSNSNEYRIILFRYDYETNNGLRVHNELCNLPEREAHKKDFDYLLLQETIVSPRCCISLYRMCFGKTQVQVSN